MAELYDVAKRLSEEGLLETELGNDIARLEIVDVEHDSRKIYPGTLFCALKGEHTDGHGYLEIASQSGAKAALVEHVRDDIEADIVQIPVKSTRKAMAHAACVVHGEPSKKLAVVAVTGTNGKTTTTQMLSSILNTVGIKTDVIGTLSGSHTTPESAELQRRLAQYVTSGTRVVALEVSSHGIALERVLGTKFEVVAFSNLSSEHLDFHRDLETYFEAKAKLFEYETEHRLVNLDDSYGKRLHQRHETAQGLSIKDLDIVASNLDGSEFIWRSHNVKLPIAGEMNIQNALMAAEIARLCGAQEDQIAEAFSLNTDIDGRMQRVEVSTPTTQGSNPATGYEMPVVFVDYSHTPDSIEKALTTLRAIAEPEQKITIVFGCGGNRDRQKRPQMARSAQQGADAVWLTSDNPRDEDPEAIIREAAEGFTTAENIHIEIGRREAINQAVAASRAGDIVLIAGKGHEKTQTIGETVHAFDDVNVAQNALRNWMRNR